MTAHANLTEKSDVPFPKELIGSRAVIQGASGAGKTYAIRRILETTHGRQDVEFSLEADDHAVCAER
jgi:ABC-type ATPase with predicted acetyltransferase domain